MESGNKKDEITFKGNASFRKKKKRHMEEDKIPLTGHLEELTQAIGVKRARDDGQGADLLANRLDQPRVGVAVTDGGVGAHHVEILLAVLVRDPDAFATREDDRQRVVVVCAITVFEIDGC